MRERWFVLKWARRGLLLYRRETKSRKGDGEYVRLSEEAERRGRERERDDGFVMTS